LDRAKPFDIPKREVWEAYKRVRANKGTAGVDGQSIADFEADLSNNLYKLWNRMSSGSYYPPPVRRVDIPKGDGRTRPLGIPTVADRVAQTVVKRFLEPLVDTNLQGPGRRVRLPGLHVRTDVLSENRSGAPGIPAIEEEHQAHG
jgi:RNA-directed DNA polymerase